VRATTQKLLSKNCELSVVLPCSCCGIVVCARYTTAQLVCDLTFARPLWANERHLPARAEGGQQAKITSWLQVKEYLDAGEWI